MIHVLLPDAKRWPALPLPIAKRLGQADGSPVRSELWLAETFGAGKDGHWPAAALTRPIDTGSTDTAGEAYLRADPAWVKADISGGKVLGIGETLPMSAADVAAFLPDLQPLFGDAGMPLDAPNPHRWYLRLQAGAPLPVFSTPAQALGDDAFEHLNFEGTHRRWKTLMSEAQILLHQHPHNVERVRLGLPPVNALWFWGAGALPAKRMLPFKTIATRDPLLAGLARHHGADAQEFGELPVEFNSETLWDLRGFKPSDCLAQSLPALLASGASRWLFEDRDAIDIASGQTWRFWRKPVQLA